MTKVIKDSSTFCQRENPYPPDQPLSTHIDPFWVNNDVPLKAEAEAEAAVRRLRPHKAGGHTHLRVDHFNTWLRKAYLVEGENPPLPNLEGL